MEMNTTHFLLPETMELIDKNNVEMFDEFIRELHPNDVMDIFNSMDSEYKKKMIDLLEIDLFTDFFEELEINEQIEIISEINLDKAKKLLDEMAPDVRVDLLQNMDEEKRNELINILAAEEKEDVKQLLKYHEDSAGGTMTTEYAHIKENMTTSEAMEFIKSHAEDFETVFYIYVLDDDKVLKGVISLKDFILSDPNTPVTEVMVKDPIYILDTDDREEAAKLLQKYNLLAMPVLDKNHKLVGMITHDDIMDVIEEEATEDMVKFGGASSLEDAYSQAPMYLIIKTRVWWLIIFLLIESISGIVLKSYEATLKANTLLMIFVPMLIGTAGNAGTQSSTVTIRSIATGDLKDSFDMIKKELMVGVFLGVILAFFTFFRAYFQVGEFLLSMTVAITLTLMVTIATLMGSIFPIIADKLNIDPAFISGPLLATLIDITGLLIYFKVSWLIMGI